MGASAATMAKRRGHAVSVGHDARRERPATGHGQPRAPQNEGGPNLSVRAAPFPSRSRHARSRGTCRGSALRDHSQQGTSRYTVLGTQRVTVVATCFGTIFTTSIVFV